jgi:hypothetical protein
MACPFLRTKDGHELQFGTNQLSLAFFGGPPHAMLPAALARALQAYAPSGGMHTNQPTHPHSCTHTHAQKRVAPELSSNRATPSLCCDRAAAPRSLGHFALVRHLQPALEAAAAASGEPARVVSLASSAHFSPYMPGGLRPDGEVDAEKGYSPWAAYGQSKLCNVLFARRARRARQAASCPFPLAAPPGPVGGRRAALPSIGRRPLDGMAGAPSSLCPPMRPHEHKGSSTAAGQRPASRWSPSRATPA